MSISRVAGRWIRWMDACGVPADHIAVVLDIDPSQVAAWLGRITRNATAWEIEQMRELRSAGYTVRAIALELGRSRSAIYDAVERGDLPAWPPSPPLQRRRQGVIRAELATRVKAFHRLDYGVFQICTILNLDVAAVRDFIARIRAQSGDGYLSRPRTRREQSALQPPRPRRERPAPIPACWKRADSRLDSAGWTPPPELPAIAAVELVIDQAAPELPATPPIERPPADGPAWSGFRTVHGERNGNSKLAAADAREIRRLRAEGMSLYALAKRYDVAENTIRAIVQFKTWQDA